MNLRHWICFSLGIGGALLSSLSSHLASAQDVRITQELEQFEFTINNQTFLIDRIQDQQNRLRNSFAKTSRACPPFCIQPMQVAEKVLTIGELELIELIQNLIPNGDGLLVDTRIPTWHQKSSIPGSINIPFNILSPDENPYLGQILEALGATQTTENTWQFDTVKTLLIYCNGSWSDQAPRAIRSLLRTGYPPEKIFYYRGGMQAWQSLGLSIQESE